MLAVFYAFWTFTSSFRTRVGKNPQKKLQQVKQELIQINQNLNKTKKIKSKEQKKIKAFDAEISKLSRKLRQLRTKKTATNKEVTELKEKNAYLEGEISKNTAAVSAMSRAIYLQGDDNYLKILMNQGSASEQSRMRIYSEYFYRAFETSQAKLTKDLLESEKINRALEAKLEEYTKLLKENKKQAKVLEASRKKKKAYIAKLNREIKSNKRKVASLASSQKTLEKLVRALKKRKHREKLQKLSGMSFAKHKGKLQWPVKGKISRKYGQSRSSGGLKWRGVLLDAKSGEKVKAIDGGTVVFSDWLSGYGFVVIIDHGKNYMSLYGHNQSLLKSVGEKVLSGDVIAEAGSSGRLGKTGLYFEIRRKGKPVNPVKWMVSRRSR